MTVKVTGLDENVAALRELAGQLENPVEALTEIAQLATDVTSSFAPRRTGRLAGSFTPDVSPGRAGVATSARYAGVVNYGWPRRNIRPALFIQRADAKLAARAAELLDQGIDDEARKAGLTVG